MTVGSGWHGAVQDRDDRECLDFMTFLASRGGENLGVRHDTFLISKEIISGRAYNFGERLPRDATVINVGAHVGILPLYVLFKGQPRRIIACEPDPFNLELLLHNTRPWRETIDVVGAAVSTETAPRFLAFRSDGVNTGAGTVGSGGIPVLSIPMNELLELARRASGGQPLYVFCDCEGGEWAVFDEGTDLGDVAVIWGEVHIPNDPKPEWGNGPHSRAEFLRLLRLRGWTVETHDSPREEGSSLPGERFLFTAVNPHPSL